MAWERFAHETVQWYVLLLAFLEPIPLYQLFVVDEWHRWLHSIMSYLAPERDLDVLMLFVSLFALRLAVFFSGPHVSRRVKYTLVTLHLVEAATFYRRYQNKVYWRHFVGIKTPTEDALMVLLCVNPLVFMLLRTPPARTRQTTEYRYR
jgi:hypothetical protein